MNRLRRGGVLLGVPVGVALLGLVLVGIWVASLGTDSRQPVASDEEDALAAEESDVTLPDFPGVMPEEARILTRDDVARRAAVWAPAEARQEPSGSSPVVGPVPVKTPEGTDNIVVALEERPDELGQLWVRVGLAVRPNGKIGWVPRQSLGPYEIIRTRLVVDRERFRATLWRNGERVFRARVGVGTADAPTPEGSYYIRNKLTKYANEFYGPIAFGTSARSPTLTDWPAGGFVGIHGTSRPDLIPGRISHGCIRMANGDIVRLARLMMPGTPLEII